VYFKLVHLEIWLGNLNFILSNNSLLVHKSASGLYEEKKANQALLSEENIGLIKVSSYSLMIPNIGCIFSSRDKGYSIFTKENS
jgi:hypothetical protein